MIHLIKHTYEVHQTKLPKQKVNRNDTQDEDNGAQNINKLEDKSKWQTEHTSFHCIVCNNQPIMFGIEVFKVRISSKQSERINSCVDRLFVNEERYNLMSFLAFLLKLPTILKHHVSPILMDDSPMQGHLLFWSLFAKSSMVTHKWNVSWIHRDLTQDNLHGIVSHLCKMVVYKNETSFLIIDSKLQIGISVCKRV